MRLFLFLIMTLLLSLIPHVLFASDECDYDRIVNNFNPATKTSDLIIRAIQSNCPELMDVLLRKEKEEDVFKATSVVGSVITGQFSADLEKSKNVYEGDPGSAEFISSIQARQKIIATFFNFIKDKCPDETQTTRACAARKLTKSMSTEMDATAKRMVAEETAKEEAQKKAAAMPSPEKIFKMKFCKNPNLLAVVFYYQVSLENGCIYSLTPQGYALTVTQSVPGGIIVGAQNGPTNGKSIFIKTKKQYADGDMVQPQFVRQDGLMKFTTVLGAQRTINAFEYLGDAAPTEPAQ